MTAAAIAWAVESIGATVPSDPFGFGLPDHGPIYIPCQRQQWNPGARTYTMIDVWPHNPGLYGRYLPIDLDENNRHSIDAYCARFPDRPRPVFGWGVCRHGFGLQHHDGVMTEAQADAMAVELNRNSTAGEDR